VNSSGRVIRIAVIRISTEPVSEIASSMSSRIGGTGTIMNSTTISVAIGSTAPLAALIQIFALTWLGVIGAITFRGWRA
jgi:hypothetical protein